MGLTLRKNSNRLKSDPFYNFDEESGYFGEHRKGARANVRTIYTDGDPIEEAWKMFRKFAGKATIVKIPGKSMWTVDLEDGTSLNLRINYPPGHAPAIQVNVRRSIDPAGVLSQKIHFARKAK